MTKQAGMTRFVLSVLAAALLATLLPGVAVAQYKQFNLVNTASDPNLVNAWGLAFFPSGPFWVSDNGTGLSTLYDHSGGIIPLVVTIPPAPSMPFGPVGSPTGIVANGTGGFPVVSGGYSWSALFIFATLDGTISGWNPSANFTNAIIAVDNSASGAVYTGLALVSTPSGPVLYAADAGNNKVDMFDSSFNFLGSFTDPAPPAGLGVYGVQNARGRLYVTLATPVPFQGGAIDEFRHDGTFIRRLTSNGPEGPLQSPWGTAIAPSDFGTFSNALLIGDVNDGHINAFDPKTGTFLGMLTHPDGSPIAIRGLWALQFGAGNPANGDRNQLFFCAGPSGYRKGLFGMIEAQGTH